MDIYIKNPSTPEYRLDSKQAQWSYNSQKITDKFRSREGSLEVPRQIPIKQFAEVRFEKSNKVKFRGYVEQYSIEQTRKKKLSLQGVEKQLEYRYPPDYFYPEGTTFAKLFADDITLNDPPGLLALANSLVAPGWSFAFHDTDDNIIRLSGCGTASRFGSKNLYYLDYKYVKELVSVHDVDELASIDNTYFRNTTDLYVRIDLSYSRGWYDRGGLLCENAFDTSIRLGECPTDTLDGDLILTCMDGKMADIITDTILAHGYFPHYNRDDEGHTYLDITEDEA